MKYLKTFEVVMSSDNLIPGHMYKHENIDVCFVGNNGTGYPLTCLLFYTDTYNEYFDFIEWIERLNFKNLNKTLKEYIIENEIVNKTLESFEAHEFSSGPSGTSLKMIKKMMNELLNDEEILLHKDAKTYNL